MATGALIDVQDLHHTYLQGTPLETPSLRGVSLSVEPGDTLGIIGPTGSGKSTLLQHLNGLIRPQRGEVRVQGHPLSEPKVDIRWVRQTVGLVFQNPEDQLFERYVGDDVAFGPRALGLSVDQVRERVRQAMATVGLPFAFKDRLVRELSQGQRRRVALAGVLAMEPRVLALDEPTAGLDPAGRAELLQMLRRWHDREPRAIVLASHNMEDIAQLCTRLAVLVAGQVVLTGTPREVFAHSDLLQAHGLDVPVATQILLGLRQRGCPLAATALTLEEAATAIEAVWNG